MAAKAAKSCGHRGLLDENVGFFRFSANTGLTTALSILAKWR